MNNILRLARFASLVVCMGLSVTAHADVKIKARQTMQGQSYENTTYIKGKRQRTEQNTGGMEMVNIMQCDLRRDLRIMPQSRTYIIDLYDRPDSTTQPTQRAANETTATRSTPTRKGGVVTTTMTAKDTGERKQMFGYTARHIITTMETASSPDACSQTKSKMQIDGWYIDAAFAFDCETERYKAYRPTSSKPDCQDRYEMKQIGAARTGYPVSVKTTMFDENGRESYTMLNEVVELSKATLDAALFDIPTGYREVKDASELYASMAAARTGSDPSDDDDGTASNNSDSNANIRNLSKTAADVPVEVGAKKPGVVRLGLATIKTGAVGDGLDAGELAAAVGGTLAAYLKAPNVELVRLEARLPTQIDREAQQKECDYVIYASVSHKKGGGGGMFGRALGNVASSAAGHIPYGGTAGTAAARAATTTAVYTAASVSANVKAKDELTIDLKLQAPGGATPAAARQFKAKARSSGEDILSPLIEQAAQTIMDAATKR